MACFSKISQEKSLLLQSLLQDTEFLSQFCWHRGKGNSAHPLRQDVSPSQDDLKAIHQISLNTCKQPFL